MTATEARAVQLAHDATQLYDNGETESAQRAIHEAVALSPSNGAVKAAVTHLHQPDHRGKLLELCNSWLEKTTSDPQAAELILKEALQVCSTQQIPDDVAAEAIRVLVTYAEQSATCDRITHLLLRQPGARKALADEIIAAPTPLFRRLFVRGDETIVAILNVLRDKTVWALESDRVAAIRDIFQLALSTSMEAGLENPERAMGLLSRLLVSEAKNLNGLMDADGFRVLLDSLDIREPILLRQHASIAIGTLIEHSPESAHTLISQYITPRVETPTTTTLIRAFSAATAVFPMATAPAVALFLSDGFLKKLSKLVSLKNSTTLTSVTIELLSAACVDTNCRQGIATNCRRWLLEKAQSPEKPVIGATAALVLAKIEPSRKLLRNGSPTNNGSLPPDTYKSAEGVPTPDFYPRFRDIVLKGDDNEDPKLLSAAIEGLAFLSLDPVIKEKIAANAKLTAAFATLLNAHEIAKPPEGSTTISTAILYQRSFSASPVFGILTILRNLTIFPPLQSEEQKKMSQLQAFASNQSTSSTPPQRDPRDEEPYVVARSERLVQAGIPSSFSRILKARQLASLNVLRLVALISVSLSRVSHNRGELVQQGMVTHMLQIYDLAMKRDDPSNTSGPLADLRFLSSLAIARVLISIDPTTVFSGASGSSLLSAIRPLLSLLDHTSGGESPEPAASRTLALFESLLALTNIASTTEEACSAIAKKVFPRLDDLLFLPNTLIVRAATELCCNMAVSFHGVAAFTDPSNSLSKSRFDVLVALADSEDNHTRRAAGGALALITSYPPGVEALLQRKGGIKRVLEMCQDDQEDVVVRATACLHNMLAAENGREILARVKKVLREENAKEMLRKCIDRQGAADIVKIL